MSRNGRTLADDPGAFPTAPVDGESTSDGGRDALAYEVLCSLAVAFSSAEPTRDDLVICALRRRMPPPIIAALRALPDRRYHSPQELRADLVRHR